VEAPTNPTKRNEDQLGRKPPERRQKEHLNRNFAGNERKVGEKGELVPKGAPNGHLHSEANQNSQTSQNPQISTR
jgi:hypothetical protein